jgi:hypothetical protein
MAIRWRHNGQARNKAEDRRIGKITINLGPIDLGQIDLLVQEGFTPTAPT